MILILGGCDLDLFAMFMGGWKIGYGSSQRKSRSEMNGARTRANLHGDFIDRRGRETVCEPKLYISATLASLFNESLKLVN